MRTLMGHLLVGERFEGGGNELSSKDLLALHYRRHGGPQLREKAQKRSAHRGAFCRAGAAARACGAAMDYVLCF